MIVVENKISLKELKKISERSFGGLVKEVVDVEKRIMVVDAELHADQEAFLLKRGSKQVDLWGINIYPSENEKDRIEFDSIINIRPNQDNTSRKVENKEIREKIKKIVNNLIK